MTDLSAASVRASDPEVMAFHNCGTQTVEQVENSLRNVIAKAEDTLPFGMRAIVMKETQKNIGYCKLGPLMVLEGNPIELSYEISRDEWGHGYATEAAASLMEHGFEVLGLDEVIAAVNPLNVPSARVAQKLGLVVREKVDWPKQGVVDLYAITNAIYEKRKEANKTIDTYR
jgi:ribosomal-protein-alanine N-acetyltransferase